MPLTIIEASQLLGITRHGVLLAIQAKRMKAKKVNNRWMIEPADINDYIFNRWNRDRSIFKGDLKFDPDKGELSIKSAAIRSKIDEQHLYYAIKKGYLPAKRKGKSWVINADEVDKYKVVMKEIKLKPRKSC